MRKPLLTIAFAVAMAAGSGSTQEFRSTPMGRIEAALRDYQAATGRWPRSIQTLQQASTWKAGRPLDLSAFSTITLRIFSPHTIFVEYALAGPGKTKGGFSVTVMEVTPR